MLTVHLRVEEAVILMRALAATQWRESDTEKQDDLELLRLRLYDSIYHSQRETIRIDHWQPRRLQVQRAPGRQQGQAALHRDSSVRSGDVWQADAALPTSAA